MSKPAKKRCFVVGVGMTKFCKPLKAPDKNAPDYPDFAKVAVERAFDDCGIKYTDIEAAAVGSVFGSKGQRSLYGIGLTGIPIFNVFNACATGSNALYVARSFIESGMHDCCLALGIETMAPGPLAGGTSSKGKASPMDFHMEANISKFEWDKSAPPNPQMFGNAGREHNKAYGSTPDHFAWIGWKNHKHSVNNPYSQFQDEYTLDQIKASPMIYDPLNKLSCSPTSDGAAACIVMSEEYVVKHGLQGQAIEIIGQSMRTDMPGAFDKDKPDTCINMVGASMAEAAANDVYAQTGKKASDVQVIELHDCFATNELITYEALGLAPKGQGHKLVETQDVTYGGKWVVNPSGGLISKGHPIGATGIAQCCELSWQLRNEAGKRQVKDAKVGLQHNLGLGGAVVVTMYQKPEQWAGVAPKRAKSGAEGFPVVMSKL